MSKRILLLLQFSMLINVAFTQTGWPVVPPPVCSQPYKIVVLGSSTAYGLGANPIDSAFVNKFRMFVLQQNPQSIVTNLATPGLNSYNVNPSNYVPPANRPSADTDRNITKGLSLNPDALIINLPSNDIAAGFSVQEFEDNINRIVAQADAQNVPVWVTTTQPRTNLNQGERNSQVILRDWINQRFGNFSIDFWTTIAQGDTINPIYAYGDGIHLNNAGHDILFRRTVYEQIWDTICNRKYGTPGNKAPVAKAGSDIVISLPNTAGLNGTSSYDPDGTISSYKWRKISGANGATIANDTARQTTVSFTAAGSYQYELTVTDNKSATGKDTLIIMVNDATNKPPLARAGNDATIQLPANHIFLDGRSSMDPDGSITAYKWIFISGQPGSSILTSAKDTTSVTFTNSGTYLFSLTVTDNKSATAADTVAITVQPAVVNSKVIRVNIYGGTNPYNNAQWNNWNTKAGLTSGTFLYDDGTASNVSSTLSVQARVADNGANYASTATICPPDVLRYTSANSANRTLTIKGLKANANYGFEFYASRAATGNSTVYTIGIKSDTVKADNNISAYAKFDNVLSSSKGIVVINLKKIGPNNFINGFIIKEQFTGGRPESFDVKEIDPKITGLKNTDLIIYPNPFYGSFNVQLSGNLKGTYKMQLINASGKIVMSKEGFSNQNNLFEQINSAGLAKGIYFLQVITNEIRMVKKIIKN